MPEINQSLGIPLDPKWSKKIPSRVKRRKGKELWTLFEDD
jgi:hypothetical protein